MRALHAGFWREFTSVARVSRGGTVKVSGRVAAALFGLAFLVSACGGGGESQPAPAAGAPAASSGGSASLDKNAYPVFPDADAGADPAVPAEQGGKGFKGE